MSQDPPKRRRPVFFDPDAGTPPGDGAPRDEPPRDDDAPRRPRRVVTRPEGPATEARAGQPAPTPAAGPDPRDAARLRGRGVEAPGGTPRQGMPPDAAAAHHAGPQGTARNDSPPPDAAKHDAVQHDAAQHGPAGPRAQSWPGTASRQAGADRGPDRDGAAGGGRRRTVFLEDGAALSAPAPSPADAPPVDGPDAAGAAAMARATRLAARRGSWLGRLAWSAAAGLVSMAAGLLAWDFVTSLAARNPWLGYVAIGLGAIVLLGILVYLLRELAGLARLARVDRLRAGAEAALRDGDRDGALAVADGLGRLYAGRADLEWSRARMRDRQDDLLDADAVLEVTERGYLAPLDAAAAREVELAARQVAVATAVIPLAFADVLAALTANMRLVRRIAEIYGGRAGTLGSWRLVRAVAAHLVATGAVAMGDDMLGAMLGGGLMSKLSRRFGEGVVNGALTARVGVAAMDVCRPLPFRSLEKPAVTGLVRRALSGFAMRS